jgi:hypothetical protein
MVQRLQSHGVWQWACARAVTRRLLPGLLLAVHGLTAPAEALFRVDGGLLYNSNVSRASNSDDVRFDAAAAVDAALGWSTHPSDVDALSAYGHARRESYDRYHGLDVTALGIGLAYTRKFGVGLTAPRLGIDVSADSERYGTSTRDANVLRATIQFRQRFNEAFQASAGYLFDRRFGKYDEPAVPGLSGKVFDLIGNSAFVTAGYELTERWLLDASVAVRRGDVVSTTHRGLAIFTASSAIAVDPTFGEEMYYYRLRGTTRTIAAALSYALNDHTSLSASYTDENTRAAEGLEYPVRIGSLTVAYRY